MEKTKFYKQILTLFVILFLLTIVFPSKPAFAQSCQTHNVWGWAWSDNIGWISFRCSGGATSHWQEVDDVLADDFGTSVWTDSNSEQKDAYNLQDPSAAGTINGIRVKMRHLGTIKTYFRLNGLESVSLGGEPISAFGSWLNSSTAWYPNAPGGGSWTWDDIRDLQVVAGLSTYTFSGTTYQGRLTQIYIEVDYNGGTLILRPNSDGDYINIENPSAGSSVDYGVDIDETGLFSGYAWSENIGWISFGDFDADGDIDADDKNIADSPCAPCEAVLDLETAEVIGWARALAGVPGVKHEYFYVPSTNNVGFAGDHWRFQTFTVGAVGPNTDHTANYISLWIRRGDIGGIPSMPGDVIVEVYDVIGSPSYPDISSLLCWGVINGNNLSTTTAGWADIPLNSGCDLSAGTEYAFVVKIPGGDDSNYIKWYFPEGDESYPGGQGGYSNDSGATWQVFGEDKFFQVWKGQPLREPFLSGWDGWIKLRGAWADGVSLISNPSPPPASVFKGWAWGSDVIGWISFNCSNIGVCGVSDYKVMTDIEVNVPPSATNLSVEQTSGCELFPLVNFSWVYSDDNNVPTGTEDPQSAYEIQIDDDSNLDEDPIATLSGGAATSRPYAPPSFGTTYWWRVRVRDTNGPAWSDWADGPNFTPTKWPDPDFIWCPPEPDISETIQFCSVFGAGVCDQAAEPSCSSMTSPADNLTTCTAGCSSWAWDFGDGGTPSNLQNPTYSYSSQGPHGVRLTVTDANGKVCFKVHWVPVNIPLPKWKEIPPF